MYVTTSYFSEQVQREVLEDRYPIILVNGLRLSEEVSELAHEQGDQSILDFLRAVDSGHDAQVMHRDPEEILFE